MADSWVTFWFEGNTAWGENASADEWSRIRCAYSRHNPMIELGKARRGPDRGGLPNFGFRREHTQPETLLSFFDANGMPSELLERADDAELERARERAERAELEGPGPLDVLIELGMIEQPPAELEQPPGIDPERVCKLHPGIHARERGLLPSHSCEHCCTTCVDRCQI